MTLRFLKDYRSRAWMVRYAAGAVANIDNPAVVDECLKGGFAEALSPKQVAPVAAPDVEAPDAEQPEGEAASKKPAGKKRA